MTLWVVDASVIIKWYVPEGDYEAARAMRTAETALAAPDLLFAETANIVWKLVRRCEMTSSRGIEIIEEIVAAPFITVSNQSLAQDALDLAIATGLSAYDASYVALAIRIDKILITADEKLVRKLTGTRSANQVRLLADYTN
ncbi:MAG TPA: type II toxin-antitoxin system VapC family toxin [Thermoanaerobaculia bacterium]|nr:type II toxin-antitoxin system VapC family toxin [Thermoanaerobaculia bacterium]